MNRRVWTMAGRWPIVGLWLVLTVAGGVVGGKIFDRAAQVPELSASAESIRAKDRIQQIVPEGPLVIGVATGVSPIDPGLVESLDAFNADMRADPAVKDVDDLTAGPGGVIGDDEKSILIKVEMKTGDPAAIDAVAARMHQIKAPKVLVGGEVLAKRAFDDQALADAALGEGLAIVAVAVLLILLLRWAALVPLGAALASVTATLLLLTGLSYLIEVSQYTVNVVTLLGLGLSIDYALLVLWRYRDELAGADPAEALRRAVKRAGRTVAIAGATVGVAMLGLSLFGEPLLARMALGGAVVVVVTTVVALTLVPALIGVLGHRVKPIQPKKARDPLKRPIPSLNTVLPRLTATAQRSPAAVAAWVVLGLLALAAPLLSANLGSSDARALPKTAEARQLAEYAKQNFQHGHPDPVSVVVDLGSGAPGMVDYLNTLNRLPGVAQLQLRFGVPAEGNVTVIDLTPSSENEAAGVVRAARAAKAPATAIVGGTAAEVVDYRDSVAGNLPLVLLVLLLATGSLLFLATGSLLIPVKALLMNLLTLAASLGVLVALFQWEWLFDSWGGIDLTTPVLLFVFIFGLSTDYEVFLLSRITEEWRRGADPDTAVRIGVTSTGPVVTTAAISLIIVFAGFMLGGLTAVKEIGTGMAVAILLDVTVVRGLLLPAVMSLLGRWNWWPRHSAPTPAVQEELVTVS